ncbi:calcium/hydrogen antiporter [Sporobolomyces salmoneus]|uniref:calcium/hydrogen antiporter n=1 Tax=Sporobolomyces salmoneus TaxID=183962 RepID=UPI00317B9540
MSAQAQAPDPNRDTTSPPAGHQSRPSSASSTSSASGETERGASSHSIPQRMDLDPTASNAQEESANLSVTPTTGGNPSTPAASSRPVASLSTASPAPTSSPTPNAHRRNLSSTSATSSSTGQPSSAFNSPARRDQGSHSTVSGGGLADVSGDILHEDSAEEEQTGGEGEGERSGYFGSVQSTPANAASYNTSRPRQSIPSNLGSTSRSRPPSAALNRRSISVNTQASIHSIPSNRRSTQHLSAPSSQQPLRSPGVYGPQTASSTRPVSRLDRPQTGMSGYEREYGSADEDSADGDLIERERERDRRRRAMSPAVGPKRRGDEDEDDEVVPVDRGEQLVKRRARERKEKRRQANIDAARFEQLQQLQQRRISSAVSTPGPDQTGFTSDQQQQHDFYPSYPDNESLGMGRLAGTSGPRARDPSNARSERSQVYSVFSDAPSNLGAGPRSPGTYWSPMPLPLPPQGGRPALGGRGSSYVSSSSVSNASTATSAIGRDDEERSIIEGVEPSSAGEEEEEERDRVRENDEEDAEELASQDPRLEDWRDGGADGEHSPDDDDGEVEYTLKDRQDAINVEHPFGLPIWKPALYKKSRSIARHADEALHSAPSSTALHHLLPVNVAWTLFAGIWLCLACIIVGTFLWFVPWGGSKYGRVIWELGGYLFWPFGKYVEGWGQEEVSDEAHGKHLEEIEDETEDEDDDEEEELHTGNESGMTYRHDDPEAQGTTYRRGRSGTINASSTGSAAPVRSRPALDGLFPGSDNLPDEPRGQASTASLRPPTSHEQIGLVSGQPKPPTYGATTSTGDDKTRRISSDETVVNDRAQRSHSRRSASGGSVTTQKSLSFRPRALGRLAYWTVFYLMIAPIMLFVCVFCWAIVFYIPMAKLLWVLLCHLNNEPLSLHFRSPPAYTPPHPHPALHPETNDREDDHDSAPRNEPNRPTNDHNLEENGSVPAVPQWPLEAGQPAPRVSRKKVADAKRRGRIVSPRSTVLLCTYKAAGLEYYKYTLDGVNIWFVNLMSLVFFVIFDFFLLEPYAEKHHSGGLLKLITGQGFIFFTALLGVIPLSYFIGMAVASISAQSSIGTGAFINASFGSAIEILLYSIALTQSKGELVEGSIVGSILAGVLLMPGLSMIGGAFKRKEQRFNARSAGVTSMMLIVAVIGVFTPTLFYEIYGSFQLTCSDCDVMNGSGPTSCRTCYYEHIDPADDPFYLSTVQYLSYFCGSILVLSYAVGIWFSLRTHASQIWQNAAPAIHEQGLGRPGGATASTGQQALDNRRSLYHRVVPSQLFQTSKRRVSGLHTASGVTPAQTPLFAPSNAASNPLGAVASPAKVDFQNLEVPNGFTPEQFRSVVRAVADAAPTFVPALPQTLRRAPSHVREVSKPTEEEDDGGHGGHDAPNWSRGKSVTVLLGCTLLYAIIAEILVDVVDVILEGSGIPEKLLGITLFALVPNTTEFMNAISFALNGNIALSMEIGSAYALQVCLIQAPAMLAFSAFYGIGKESMLHRAFTLVFPRWDILAILFSVFLLTYVYIEARSNYFRGVLLCLSYCLLLAGFAFAPSDRDTSDNPGFGLLSTLTPNDLTFFEKLQALAYSLFTK